MKLIAFALSCTALLACDFSQPDFPRAPYRLAEPMDNEQRIARVMCSVPLKGNRMPIDQALAATRSPGVSVAAMVAGQVVWARAYGSADPTRNRAMTPETVLQAASVSKPMTAVAIMKMVQAGEISLDADVTDAVGWEPRKAGHTRITLRQLMSHTSGLGIHGFGGYPRNREEIPETLDVLNGVGANSARVRLEHPPGETHYSGGGWTLVQAYVEEEVTSPFEEAMYEWLIRPFRLSHSTFIQPIDEAHVGYAASAFVDGAPVPMGHHVYPEKAAAGMWTTPTDLLTVGASLMNAYNGMPGPLSQARVREMMTPVIPGQKFGLGFALAFDGQVLEASHGGVNRGFSSKLIIRSDGFGVAVMVNTNGPLAEAVARSVGEEYGWNGTKPANACN